MIASAVTKLSFQRFAIFLASSSVGIFSRSVHLGTSFWHSVIHSVTGIDEVSFICGSASIVFSGSFIGITTAFLGGAGESGAAFGTTTGIGSGGITLALWGSGFWK